MLPKSALAPSLLGSSPMLSFQMQERLDIAQFAQTHRLHPVLLGLPHAFRGVVKPRVGAAPKATSPQICTCVCLLVPSF